LADPVLTANEALSPSERLLEAKRLWREKERVKRRVDALEAQIRDILGLGARKNRIGLSLEDFGALTKD